MIPDPGLRNVPTSSWEGLRAAARGLSRGEDHVVVEEPLEYRIAGKPLATVMRTPGQDRDLALGFFFTDGWISGIADVGSLRLCSRGGNPEEENVADLIPAPGTCIEVPGAPRATAVTSSCGVCGKRTIEEVLAAVPPPGASAADPLRLEPRVVLSLPPALRSAQRLFERTGALHAAGVFDRHGRLLRVREDIGRHNAVDKAIGAALLAGEVPLSGRVLVVSGRASFEIIQKALRARIPVVAAVSGVSSLARDLAESGGITLIGFLRDASFRVYAHPERFSLATPAVRL